MIKRMNVTGSQRLLKTDTKSVGFIRIEVLLIAALSTLVLQLTGHFFPIIVWLIDVQTWSRATWIGINFLVILFLVFVRFGPGLLTDWRFRRGRLTMEFSKRREQEALKRRRELLKCMKQSQRRRIY